MRVRVGVRVRGRVGARVMVRARARARLRVRAIPTPLHLAHAVVVVVLLRELLRAQLVHLDLVRVRVEVRVRVRVRVRVDRRDLEVGVEVADDALEEGQVEAEEARHVGLLHGADERDRLCEVRVGALLAARHDQHALHLGRDGVRMRSKG